MRSSDLKYLPEFHQDIGTLTVDSPTPNLTTQYTSQTHKPINQPIRLLLSWKFNEPIHTIKRQNLPSAADNRINKVGPPLAFPDFPQLKFTSSISFNAFVRDSYTQITYQGTMGSKVLHGKRLLNASCYSGRNCNSQNYFALIIPCLNKVCLSKRKQISTRK